MIFMLLLLGACNNVQENNASSEKEVTPKPPAIDVHAAAFMGNVEAIRQHVLAGTDVDQKDPYGSTPLNTATVFGKTDAALLLIEAGADVNLKNAEGSTPLHNAAFFCRTEIVKALLEKGADKSLKNNYGSTAYASVSGPFSEVKPIYDQIGKELGKLGLRFDYEFIEKERPVIAKMLK